MEQLWNDLNIFKKSGMYEELKSIYDLFPETECLKCGTCCYDPPKLTYPEFLYMLDFFIIQSFTKCEVINIYKKMYYEKLFAFIRHVKCGFLAEDNSCIIHDASPLNCKRWGLQSLEENKHDKVIAEEKNIAFEETILREYGLKIRSHSMLEYCDNVKIVARKKSIDYDEIYKTVNEMEAYFANSSIPEVNMNDYFLAAFFKKDRIFFDQIRQTKKYQAGDINAIENYIATIDFERPLEKLLSYFN